MQELRHQDGPNWKLKFKKKDPIEPAHSSSLGTQGKGNPIQDAQDRLRMAMVAADQEKNGNIIINPV